MPQLTFNLAAVACMDEGKITDQFSTLIRAASADCLNRPALAKRREVTLRVYLEPAADAAGQVAVTVELGGKTPGHKSTCYLMRPTVAGGLQFHPDLPGEPTSQTLWDAAAAAAGAGAGASDTAADEKIAAKARALHEDLENGHPGPAAGAPATPVADVNTVSVADLGLAEGIWKRLDQEGLSTVGDLRRLQAESGSLDHTLAEAHGFGRAEAFQVAQALREFLLSQPRACRVCGCTDADCRACIAKTGEPCHWVEEDLCSACAPEKAEPAGSKRPRKARAR